jgi:hypothetical protein
MGRSGSQISHSRESKLRFIGRFAIQNTGQPDQRLRCARRTLYRAITDAVAILAEISPRQGHMLHREEFHRVTPRIGVFHPFTPIDRPATRQNSSSATFTPMAELKLLLHSLMDAATHGKVALFA